MVGSTQEFQEFNPEGGPIRRYTGWPPLPEELGKMGPDTVTLDPSDPFEAVVLDMVLTNRKKRADYASNESPFQNFIESSEAAGLSTPGQSCEVLIGTKQSRLKNLLYSGKVPKNEAIEDTFLDRAVYCTIALAMYRVGAYAENKDY